MNLICWIKRHKRGKTKYLGDRWWRVDCSRCGYRLEYISPRARLVGMEMKFGFTGK